MKPCALLVLLCVVPNYVLGRPQLVIVDDPKTAERTHPPSPEDLEERRQALVNALSPAAILGGAANPVMSLQDLGLDLVGGITRNSADFLRPLTDAKRKAKSNFPRLGDVINNVGDSARNYRKQIGTGVRDTLSTLVNNAIRIFTTASARGSAVVGGVLRLLRTLFDNFTYSIGKLAERIGSGVQRITSTSTRFIANNVQRARKFIQSPRLLQPARDITNLKVGLVKGLASDIQEVQPWKQEILQSKLSLGAKLIPRVGLGNILRPGADSQQEKTPEAPKPEEDAAAEDEVAASDNDSIDPISPASSNIEESKPTSESKGNVASSTTPVSSSTTADTTTTTTSTTTETPSTTTTTTEIPSTTTSASTTSSTATSTTEGNNSSTAATSNKATDEKSNAEKDALSTLFGLSS